MAEGAYRDILRSESAKHDKGGIGYLDWGGAMTDRQDSYYQEWFSPQL